MEICKMKITKQRLKEIIKEELLTEGRDNLIKKQTVKTPFGNLKFEVWEIMSGPGQSSMLSFDIEFNGTNIQDTTIEGESGGMQKLDIKCVRKK